MLTIDFETYYDRDYSLSKMTTEEYIRDPRFEAIGVSVGVDDEPPVWFSGTERKTKAWLDNFDWGNALAVAHNAVFDMAILNWRFGIRPKRIVDTLSMARALGHSSVSLATLSKEYGLGEKGTEVINALGKRRLDFTEHELDAYGAYCCNDTALTRKLSYTLGEGFPLNELKLIDLTIRMFTEPVLELDKSVLVAHLEGVKEKKASLMRKMLISKEQLMSNPQLADVLRSLGVDPPMKTSPTTGKETYAFAKNDEAFKDLLEHENTIVQAVVAARLGVKSTLEETRTERFIGIAERGALPIPLRYYAAHTGRWGGDDKVNMQNLPRKSDLKKAIRAPEGHVVIDSDSSQIEARTLAWLAQQDDLVVAFDNGEDVYRIMAAKIYGRLEEDITKDERFVGKTTILGCFGEDTEVLTCSGWKPIVEVQTTDMVWDGEEWVRHQGVVFQGMKQTQHAWGVHATPDHEILTEHGWRAWSAVLTDPSLSRSALSKANSPSLDGSATQLRQAEGQAGTPGSAALADGSAWSCARILPPGEQPGVRTVGAKPESHPANITGAMSPSYRTKHTAPGSSIASRRVSLDAIIQTPVPTQTTEVGASMCTRRGGQTERLFFDTSWVFPGGTTPISTSTEKTTLVGMNPVISGLRPEKKTMQTVVQSARFKHGSKSWRSVYDIAHAGPRNRFMIRTEAGPMLVHNCGYGMGALKFQAQLKTFGVDTPLDECQRIIETYRETYECVPELWREAQQAIIAMANDETTTLGRDGVLSVEGRDGIRLPNGLYLRYPNLRRWQNEETGKVEYVYDTKKGRVTIPNRIYGGKCVENICQALARIVIGEQMLKVARRYRPVMTVHDAIATVVPATDAAAAQKYVKACMRTRPAWGLQLPLNCEAGYGPNYGECK